MRSFERSPESVDSLAALIPKVCLEALGAAYSVWSAGFAGRVIGYSSSSCSSIQVVSVASSFVGLALEMAAMVAASACLESPAVVDLAFALVCRFVQASVVGTSEVAVHLSLAFVAGNRQLVWSWLM